MNCDGIARFYQWIEYAAFGKALQRRRAAFLPEASRARRVLTLGDGDGRALVALLNAAPSAHVDYVDVSAKMLELAQARVLKSQPRIANTHRVQFRQADVRVVQLDEITYDLIVTHFFLDCFDARDLQLLTRKIARAAGPEARWIVSEFRPANAFAKLFIAVMYSFFGKATALQTRRLVDHHPHFLRHGFLLERSQQAWGGMLASELWVRSTDALTGR